MYLMNTKTEGIYLKQRHNTIKLAIQNGAHIVPLYFFGNTKIFNLVGIASILPFNLRYNCT